MKKKYFDPDLEIVEINEADIIFSSGGGGGDDPEPGACPGYVDDPGHAE